MSAVCFFRKWTSRGAVWYEKPKIYEIWFYQTVGEPKPPAGAKII